MPKYKEYTNINKPKPVEIVHELKNEYKILSFEEFMKDYQVDEKVNYADLESGDIGSSKGYGPCSSSSCPYSSSFHVKIRQVKDDSSDPHTYFRAGRSHYAIYYDYNQWTARETGFMWHKRNWEAKWIEAYSIDIAKKFLEGLRKGYDEGIWISHENYTGEGNNEGTHHHAYCIIKEAIEKHERGESVSVDAIVKGCKHDYSPTRGAYNRPIVGGYGLSRDYDAENEIMDYWQFGPGSFAGEGNRGGHDSGIFD